MQSVQRDGTFRTLPEMHKLKLESLRAIGLTLPTVQHLIQQLPQHPLARPVRVTEVHRETLRLDDGDADFTARPLPRLALALADQRDAIAVGDWGLAQPDEHGGWWLARLLPRFGLLARRDADGSRHVVAANVDTALLVMGLDADFNPRRLERFLALVHSSGVEPVVVLSKPDLHPDPQAAAAALQARLPAGTACLALDGRSTEGVAALAPWLIPGRSLVLLGSSGAGKSTLANSLLGAAVQATGGTRDGDGRGRHTTTARSLHRLPGGACLIDTPGVRALRPDGGARALAAGFDDIATLASQCRFRNCRHEGEPGCAVREGVEPDRIANFQKLERELQRDALTALERRDLRAQWKARGRVARVHLRAKRGE